MVNILCNSGKNYYFLFGIFLLVAMLQGCSNVEQVLPSSKVVEASTNNQDDYRYVIGASDSLKITIWKNNEISSTVVVAPDGFISPPLVEEIKVSGKKASEVAEILEKLYAEYIREPIITVQVKKFVGPYREQVRVIGEAADPKKLAYKDGMTLLDVIISVKGLTEFADGNGALLARVVDGQYTEFSIRMDDLLQDGDMGANVDILPGDIIIIPESWF